jgi:hypothetical protein
MTLLVAIPTSKVVRVLFRMAGLAVLTWETIAAVGRSIASGSQCRAIAIVSKSLALFLIHNFASDNMTELQVLRVTFELSADCRESIGQTIKNQGKTEFSKGDLVLPGSNNGSMGQAKSFVEVFKNTSTTVSNRTNVLNTLEFS